MPSAQPSLHGKVAKGMLELAFASARLARRGMPAPRGDRKTSRAERGMSLAWNVTHDMQHCDAARNFRAGYRRIEPLFSVVPTLWSGLATPNVMQMAQC